MEKKDILKYRSAWMCFAIIWIVIFHSNINFSNKLLNYIKSIGYGGVDIFVFASGIGCFYSFTKDENVFNFIKRRFLKIMPTYWSFIIIWFVEIIMFNKAFPLTSVLGNIFCVENFIGTGRDFNWYMSAMWLFYILAPLMAQCVKKMDSNKKKLMYLIMLIIFSISFWNCETLIITISRIPIFFCGMCFAKECKEDGKLDYKSVIFLILLMLIGIIILFIFEIQFKEYLWKYAFYWYPFILITPGICIIISILMKIIDNFKIGQVISKYIFIIGNNTFEIYLIHILLFEINNRLQMFSPWTIIILLIPITIIFKFYCKFIKHIFTKIFDDNKIEIYK